MKTWLIKYLLTSKNGQKLTKGALLGGLLIFLTLIIIPVAFIEAINPFKSNPYLTTDEEREARQDDVYDLAFKEICEERNEELTINLEVVRIIEYFVVFDTKRELTDVTQEEAKEHLEEYYIYQERKEEIIEKVDEDGNPILDEETGLPQHEVKVSMVSKAKTIDSILDDLSVDYPQLLNDSFRIEILNIYDFQKNISKQKIHGGGAGQPLDEECYVYQEPFGEYLDGGSHGGADLSGQRGTPIMAVADGVVVDIVNDYEDTPTGLSFEEAKAYYGKENYIKIEHDVLLSSGDILSTRYMHNLKWELLPYSIGDTVKQGEIIGYIGNSGMSTGYHLHFETWINDERVDPLTFFDFGQLRDTNGYVGCGY